MKIILPVERGQMGIGESGTMASDGSRVLWLIRAILGLGTLALYWRVTQQGFIAFDDISYVVNNWHVSEGFRLHDLAWAFTSGYASNWHPLTWLSHMLDVQLFGVNHPGAHHFTSLLLHAANALLLFEVLRRMTGKMWRSAMVAALFAWHPLHVESVAWIAERKDVLSAFFGFLSLLFYQLYSAEGARRLPRANLFYGLALLGFALGLMSKPMLVTLPFVLLILDYWPLQRVCKTGGDLLPAQKTWPHLVLEKAPFFILTLLASIVTYLIQKNSGAVNSLGHLSLGFRALNSFSGYSGYLQKMVWPVKLAIFYPLPREWPFWRGVLGAILIIFITVVSVRHRKNRPYLLAGWLWFLGTLVPVIGLVQVGSQSMADRYSYIPLIGLFIMAVWGISDLSAGWKQRTPVWAAAALVLIASVALTTHQIGFWKNDMILFEHAQKVTAPNPIVENNLGMAYLGEGDIAKAVEHFQVALQMDPGSSATLCAMAMAATKENSYLDAAKYYEAALAIRPKDGQIHYNLGNTLVTLGQLNQAAEEYSQASRLEPDFAEAHNNLGAVLYRLGQVPEAVTQFKEALRDKPDYPEAHVQLGNACLKLNRTAEALAHFAEAVRLQPGMAVAQFKLGYLLAQAGDEQEAVSHFMEALKVDPKNANTWFNLGAAEEAMRHTNSAIAAFNEVLKIKPADAVAKARIAALVKPK